MRRVRSYARIGHRSSAAKSRARRARGGRRMACAQLATRAEQLARLLLSAMSAAHDQGELANARCFDGALKELHSLQRQVAFHGERVLDPALAAPDRERHTRALVLNNARLDYVAQSTSRCGDADASVKHGQTRVETYFEDGAIR